MVSPAQGDIWWAEAEDKRRPVLIVTRSEAIPVLDAARDGALRLQDKILSILAYLDAPVMVSANVDGCSAGEIPEIIAEINGQEIPYNVFNQRYSRAVQDTINAKGRNLTNSLCS